MGKINGDTKDLIYKYLTGTISDEEKSRFNEWLESDPRHELFVNGFRKRGELQSREQFSVNLDLSRAVAKFEKRTGKSQNRRWNVRRLMKYAAILIPLIMVGILNLRMKTETHEIPDNILGGTSRAYLFTDEGMVLLEAGAEKLIPLSSSRTAHFDGSGIVYDKDTDDPVHIQLNKLATPRGGEFEVTLSDGTRVWLNAETTLEYPAAFGGQAREVILTGEAFFEVSKDKRPFIVKTGETKIEVLGTTFGVSCYAEDNGVSTVLETGRIRFESGGETVDLTPGERAVAYPSGEIYVSKVDTRNYTAWRHGRYYFDHAPLSEIMTILGRWYDVDFSFTEPSLGKLNFSGMLLREKPLNYVLNLLQQTQSIKLSMNDEGVILVGKI